METKTEPVKINPELRRKGIMNSAILALQFAMISLVTLKVGQTFFGVCGVLATVFTINDALSFYYANKEK